MLCKVPEQLQLGCLGAMFSIKTCALSVKQVCVCRVNNIVPRGVVHAETFCSVLLAFLMFEQCSGCSLFTKGEKKLHCFSSVCDIQRVKHFRRLLVCLRGWVNDPCDAVTRIIINWSATGGGDRMGDPLGSRC